MVQVIGWIVGAVLTLLAGVVVKRLPVVQPDLSAGKLSGLGPAKVLSDRRRAVELELVFVHRDEVPWTLRTVLLHARDIGVVGRWHGPFEISASPPPKTLRLDLAILTTNRDVNPEVDGRGNRHQLMSDEVAAGITGVELYLETRGAFRRVVRRAVMYRLQNRLEDDGDPTQIYSGRVLDAVQRQAELDPSTAKASKRWTVPHPGTIFEVDVSPRTPTTVIEGWRKLETSELRRLAERHFSQA